MVIGLLKSLPQIPYWYTVYLDNYFTTVGLFSTLQEQKIGACGTTRTHNKDIPPLICVLKESKPKMEWNTLCTIPKDNVLCFAWQDNSIVTGLSTVHTVFKSSDLIERERCHPAKTSTSAQITHPVFGDQPQKVLYIPTVIDDYNHHMGGG